MKIDDRVIYFNEQLIWTLNVNYFVVSGLRVPQAVKVVIFEFLDISWFSMSMSIRLNFRGCTLESILTACISTWYGNCSDLDHLILPRVVNTVQCFISLLFSSMQSIFAFALHEVGIIIKDGWQPGHLLFFLLLSGRKCRSLKAGTSKLKHSFCTAIWFLNQSLLSGPPSWWCCHSLVLNSTSLVYSFVL